MKLAIVIPWIFTIGGNITALDLAEELSLRGNEVDLITDRLYSGIMSELKSKLAHVNLVVGSTIATNQHGRMDFFRYQYMSDLGSKIFQTIKRRTRIQKYDLVLLISNEGLSLGKLIRKRLDGKTKSAISVMELVEHNFQELRVKYGRALSMAVYPLYRLLHRRYKKLLSYYDFVFANSQWTSDKLLKEYGHQSAGLIQSISGVFLTEELANETIEEAYIATPTASLGRKEEEIVNSLIEGGLNLKLFGPRKMNEEAYMGFLSMPKMIHLIKNASATLFLFDYEALGLLPLESLALGTKVITYDKQGPSRFLSQNENVVFVEDYEQILLACRTVLQTKVTRQSRENCRKDMLSYSVKNNADEFLRVLRSYEQ